MTALRAVIRADLEQMAEGQPLSRLRLVARLVVHARWRAVIRWRIAQYAIRKPMSRPVRALAYRPDSGLERGRTAADEHNRARRADQAHDWPGSWRRGRCRSAIDACTKTSPWVTVSLTEANPGWETMSPSAPAPASSAPSPSVIELS